MTEHEVEDFDFHPAISATGAGPDSGKSRRAAASSGGRRRATWRRRLSSGVVLIAALASMGGVYAAFASSSGADNASYTQADVKAGQALFETSCITCHGGNLQGVVGRGPSLLGVGEAAVYFQVSTGRMPAPGQSGGELRKKANFTEEQTNQLAAYVQSVGGGPTIPQGNLRGGSLSAGGELFRLNCASCHGFTGHGAPLSAGKIAPGLLDASDKQMYGAMLSGPENMPVFSDNQLTPDQKKSIINYIQTLKESKDPGGAGLARIGPVSEGLVIWALGIGALMFVILWIGRKS